MQILKDYRAVINDCATRYKLDPILVQSIILTESGGNQWSMRFEPQWHYHLNEKEYADLVKVSVFTETTAQATSWGLMQVMGSVARELGFKEELVKLCLPEHGIEYGCKLLRRLSDKYPIESDIIAGYNAGSPRKLPSGIYENERYVDQVSSYLRRYRALVKKTNL